MRAVASHSTHSTAFWRATALTGWFDERTFRNVAASFANLDWAAVTNHSYRSRWGEAAFDPRSVKIETKIKATKRLNNSDGLLPRRLGRPR